MTTLTYKMQVQLCCCLSLIVLFSVVVATSDALIHSSTRSIVRSNPTTSNQFNHQSCIVCHNSASSTSQAINIAAIKAISKLISTCGVGVLAGRSGLLDQNALSVCSKLIFSLFQPCLLFTKVASTIAENSDKGGGSSLIILPLLAIIQIFIGYAIGKLMSFIIHRQNLDSEDAKALTVCSTFANSGPLPLVFTDCLFANHPDKTLLPRSIAYISLYLLGWSPGFWIGAPAILRENDPNAKTQSQGEKMRELGTRIFSPPVVGSILGMVVGFIPFFKSTLISPSGFLNPIFEAMKTIGTAYLPLVLMVLAGSLSSSLSTPATTTVATSNSSSGSDKSNQSEIDRSKNILVSRAKESQSFAIQVISVYFVRFFIFPTLSFGLLGLLRQYIPSLNALFLKDPLLLMILLLETCMPSAQNTTVVLQLQGKKDAAGRLARLLLVLYVLGIPAMSYWLIRILHLTGLAA